MWKWPIFGHLMQEPTHWKRPWCWERLKAGGEGDDRGWDGWMASPTRWTWVWVSSGSWWWTGKPGMLQSMGLQRVRHGLVTKHQHIHTLVCNLESILKSRDITLPKKVCLVKAMVFLVVMCGCELDYKESWAPKNWCFWTVVLEKTPESPLDCKEIQPVHPKGN